MKSILTVTLGLLLFQLFFINVVLARRSEKVVVESTTQNNNHTQNKTDWRDWISYAFRPPSSKQVEIGLEERWKQLQQDAIAFHQTAQAQMEQVDKTLETKRKQLQQHVELNLLKQQQGWKRFRNSARAQVGMVLGGVMTFAGGALEQTMPSVQAAQLTWGILDKHNITRGIHDPWLKDAAAGILAISLIGSTKGKSLKASPVIERVVPLLTISLAIVDSVRIILDNYDGDVSPAARVVTELVSAIAGTAVLSLLPLPLSVVAASIGGAILLFQSIVTEVVQNWFHMLKRGARKFEQLDRKQRRKIERGISMQVSKVLEKKLLYPVKTAYDEIQAAIRNETLAEPTLEDKVHKAIQHSMKVKVVWSLAAAGIVFQILWETKPVERVWTRVHSWWKDLRTSRPKAIKKRRKD